MTTRVRFYLPAAHHHPRRPHFLAWLLAGMDRARQRYRLAELDDHLLRDIGITTRQAREESEKPFWQGEHRE